MKMSCKSVPVFLRVAFAKNPSIKNMVHRRMRFFGVHFQLISHLYFTALHSFKNKILFLRLSVINSTAQSKQNQKAIASCGTPVPGYGAAFLCIHFYCSFCFPGNHDTTAAPSVLPKDIPVYEAIFGPEALLWLCIKVFQWISSA